MAKKGKNGIIHLENSPYVVSYAAAVGKKEGEGPFAAYFDCVDMSPSPDGCSWEQEESGLQQKALHTALKKGGFEASDIDILYAGDLLNQSISSTFGLREFGIPFVGLFGACSTMSLSLSMASLAVDSGAAEKQPPLRRPIFVPLSVNFAHPSITAASGHRRLNGQFAGRERSLSEKAARSGFATSCSAKSPTSAKPTPTTWAPPWHLPPRTPYRVIWTRPRPSPPTTT